MPKITNPQITDGVTQSSVTTLGNVAPHSIGQGMAAASQAFALSMQNALTQQQQNQMIGHVNAVNQMNLLYAVGTPVAANVVDTITNSTSFPKMQQGETSKILKVKDPPEVPPKPRAYPSYPT